MAFHSRRMVCTLVGAQNVEPADRTLRIRNRRLQQPHQPPRHRLDARAIEQVGGVFQHPLDPRRRAVRTALLRQGSATGRTSRSPSPPPQSSPLSPGKLQPKLRVVLQHQHHLEQRMTRQRARRIEHLHQTLERKLLVAVGRQVARTHPRQPTRGSSELPDVSVRSTSVLTKNPTRSSSALSVRPAIGLPIGMSSPAPSRVSSARKPSLQHHEQARPARARKLQQPSVQRPRQPQTNAPPAIARHRRSRTVDRKIELIRKPSQRAGPERQLARNRALRIAPPTPEPRAATACSRHTAPAAPQARGRCPRQRAS